MYSNILQFQTIKFFLNKYKIDIFTDLNKINDNKNVKQMTAINYF